MKYITFYTGHAYFKNAADSLKQSCNHLGIDIQIDHLAASAEYWKNTLRKPGFILHKMLEMQRDIIWIDVDTHIKGVLPIEDWNTDIIFATHTGKLDGIKASPLGFKYNQRSIDFLKSWEEVCLSRIASNSIDFDHDILKYEILPKFAGRISMKAFGYEERYSDYTNGRIIDNGISRIPGKSDQVRQVENKNYDRCGLFEKLRIEDYGFGEEKK